MTWFRWETRSPWPHPFPSAPRRQTRARGPKTISSTNACVSFVPYASIDGTISTLPATPVSMNRRVFEIAPGANSAGIQQAIDQAATLSGQRPVVHLPKGSYSIGTTLSVPANTDLQIVGDGWNSVLSRSGAADGTILRMNGPSRAILRELGTNGGRMAETLPTASLSRMRISRGLAFTSKASRPSLHFKPRCSPTD